MPKRISQEVIANIHKMSKEGKEPQEIAAELGVSYSSVSARLRKAVKIVKPMSDITDSDDALIREREAIILQAQADIEAIKRVKEIRRGKVNENLN